MVHRTVGSWSAVTACRLQFPPSADCARPGVLPAQATQQAKMIQNGNPYRTLFSRAYRPQLVITVLVGQGS